MNLFAVGDVNEFEVCGAQSNAVAARSVVLAVIPGLYADAGQAQEGRRHACNGRIFLPRDQENCVLSRAHDGPWRRGRAHHIQNFFRGLVVSGCALRGRGL